MLFRSRLAQRAQVVDRQVLLHQAKTARQGVSGLLGGQALESAMADAVVLPEVAVHGLEAMVGLAGDDVRFLPFGVALPANNALMSQSRSNIVQCGAARDERAGLALMLGENASDPAVVDVEQLGEVGRASCRERVFSSV